MLSDSVAGQSFPFFRLGLFDEGQNLLSKETTIWIKGVPVSFLIATCCCQVALDCDFKGMLGVLLRYLKEALVKLNPGLPDKVYQVRR